VYIYIYIYTVCVLGLEAGSLPKMIGNTFFLQGLATIRPHVKFEFADELGQALSHQPCASFAPSSYSSAQPLPDHCAWRG
jgi:hypothetical protein